MKWKLFYPSIIVLLLTGHSPSFSKNTDVLNSQRDWFVGLGVGAQFTSWRSDMRINNGSVASAPYDRFSMTNNNGPVLAVSTGRRWKNEDVWFPAYSLGIFWQYFFKTSISGQIEQYSLPEFTNYNYHLHETTNILLASAKINLFQYRMFSPFIHGGIGGALSHISNYIENAKAGIIPRVSPGFRNANSCEFAFNIGVGIDLQLMPQSFFSVGYIFQDIGPISSSTGIGTWAHQVLQPGFHYTNEVLITVTYLLG